MKITLKTLLCAAVAAVLALPLSAVEPDEAEPTVILLEEDEGPEIDLLEDEGEKEVRLVPPVRLIDNAINEVELTKEQEDQYQQIFKQYAPQIQKQYVQQQQIYTPDQKQKRREVTKKGKEDGLKGQKLRQYVQSQIPLTPEQQKQYTDYETEIKKGQQKFRQDVVKILTPQQQELLPPIGGKKGKGKGKRGKPPTPGQDNPVKPELELR